MMDLKLRGLLRQGERAARLGKAQAAEDVYRQAVEQFPDSAEAWLGLSQVVADEQERVVYARRATELDPLIGPAVEESSAFSDLQESPLDAVARESGRWLDEVTGAVPQADTVDAPEPVQVKAVPAPAVPMDETAVCHYHPGVETSLRCNRCGKPICTRCAIKTPVGYRCKECVKEQQGIFYSVQWYDYVLAIVVALPLAAIAAYVINSIGWLTFIISPFAGGAVAEAVRFVIRRRRGRWIPLLVVICIVISSLPSVGLWALGLLLSSASLATVLNLVWYLVYLVLAAGTAYYRLK